MLEVLPEVLRSCSLVARLVQLGPLLELLLCVLFRPLRLERLSKPRRCSLNSTPGAGDAGTRIL